MGAMAGDGAVHRSSRSAWRRLTFGLALLGLAVLVAVAVASMLWPLVEDRSNVDVPFEARGAVAQRFSAFGLDGWLVRQADGSVRAFSAADAHLRCRVEFIPVGHPLYAVRSTWKGLERGMFVDRCMHSLYDADGKPLYGPAPWGLDEFLVHEVHGGRLYLDLSRVMRGECSPGLSSTQYCSVPGRPRFGEPARVDEGYTSRFIWPVAIR